MRNTRLPHLGSVLCEIEDAQLEGTIWTREEAPDFARARTPTSRPGL